MKGKKHIVYLMLALAPTAFLLFLLATINILFLLAAIIVLLTGLIVLKRYRPDWFRRREREDDPKHAITRRDVHAAENPQVLMVLTGCEDFGARRITVNKNVYSIGRSKDNDFPIDNPRISRHHLRVEYNPVERVCYAIDVGSKNGTFVNSVRMTEGQRYRLMQGDQVMIDDCAFIVEYAHY